MPAPAVRPSLALAGAVAVAGGRLDATLRVENDGPALAGAVAELHLGEARAVVAVGDVATGGVAEVAAGVHAPGTPGRHLLVVVVRAGERVAGSWRRPVQVVDPPAAPYPVRALGGAAELLALVGASAGDDGPVVVAEDALDAGVGAEAAAVLAAGGTVAVLAQPAEAAAMYPVPVTLGPAGPGRRRTTADGALPSLPRHAVLDGEDGGLPAPVVVTAVDGRLLPAEPVVLAGDGTVVGGHRCGPGRLLLCQYRLAAPAAAGHPAALALLAGLVRWAADPRPGVLVEATTKDDGRRLTYYAFPGWPR